MTLLCDFESTINSRTLTYVTDDHETLKPLKLSMFQPLDRSDVQDLDTIYTTNLNKLVKCLHKLRESLRSRFKNEYLAILIHRLQGKQRETKSMAI